MKRWSGSLQHLSRAWGKILPGGYSIALRSSRVASLVRNRTVYNVNIASRTLSNLRISRQLQSCISYGTLLSIAEEPEEDTTEKDAKDLPRRAALDDDQPPPGYGMLLDCHYQTWSAICLIASIRVGKPCMVAQSNLRLCHMHPT